MYICWRVFSRLWHASVQNYTQDECCTIPGRRRRRLLQEDRIRYLGGMLTDKQCYVWSCRTWLAVMSTCDILGNQRIQDVIEMLRAERQDESVWNELYQSALNSAKSFDISDSMPRRCGRQPTRVNHPAETPKQYWRISLYYPFLDNLITNLNHVSLNRKTASMHIIYCPVL
jgi:hypothetical protein